MACPCSSAFTISSLTGLLQMEHVGPFASANFANICDTPFAGLLEVGAGTYPKPTTLYAGTFKCGIRGQGQVPASRTNEPVSAVAGHLFEIAMLDAVRASRGLHPTRLPSERCISHDATPA